LTIYVLGCDIVGDLGGIWVGFGWDLGGIWVGAVWSRLRFCFATVVRTIALKNLKVLTNEPVMRFFRKNTYLLALTCSLAHNFRPHYKPTLVDCAARTLRDRSHYGSTNVSCLLSFFWYMVTTSLYSVVANHPVPNNRIRL